MAGFSVGAIVYDKIGASRRKRLIVPHLKFYDGTQVSTAQKADRKILGSLRATEPRPWIVIAAEDVDVEGQVEPFVLASPVASVKGKADTIYGVACLKLLRDLAGNFPYKDTYLRQMMAACVPAAYFRAHKWHGLPLSFAGLTEVWKGMDKQIYGLWKEEHIASTFLSRVRKAQQGSGSTPALSPVVS